MADEAYRAVFLRVHPTGKMVLSLTTEADGNEGRLRAARRRRARRAGARRQGRARRREPLRHRPRLQHEPVGRHAGGDRQARPARSSPRRSCSRASTSTPRRQPAVGQRRVRRAATAQARTIADLALYAHGTGALPPGRRGRPRRADRLRGLTWHWRSRHAHPRARRRHADRPHRQGGRGREGRAQPRRSRSTRWNATLEVGDDAAASRSTADARSLRVLDGSGGMRLARRRRQGGHQADDRRGGAQGHADRVPLERRRRAAGRPAASGRARADRRRRARSRSTLDVDDDGRLTGSAMVKQTDWKMKPYSALFGTLKVADVVEVQIDARVPDPDADTGASTWLSSTTRSRPASRPTTTGRRSSTSTGIIPCVEGGRVLERTSPTSGQGRDQGQDGRDVDDVPRHGRGHRAATTTRTARCCRSSPGRRRPGLRERRRHVHARRRRRHDPHRGADQRQGRVDGRGRRASRARRADQGLHDASWRSI